MTEQYTSTWNSIRDHMTPSWFTDAKFGIYTHWGVYAVPAYGPNATWYPYNMYREGTPQHEYHIRTYGHPGKFGYKDFIPMLTGAKFDADEWAELFSQAGAQYAGPVGEHHDGFCMWDTKYSDWNATKMGPHRDVVGELERAIRRQNMRFMVALHHAENWWFYPHWRKDFDTSDPRYAGLYGEPHNLHWADNPPPPTEGLDIWNFIDKPSKTFLDQWFGKTLEVIDKYQPDLLWFDDAIERVQEHYVREMLAYYYNRAVEWGKDVVLTYKWHHLVPGAGIVDLELGRFDTLAYHEWLTDTTVDDGRGWGYLNDTGYKSLRTLVHYLIDNVSKNGHMLLNVGPKPNGELPAQAKELLAGIGKWLAVNGEAIYGTTPWKIYGEGPTKMKKAGYFMEDEEVQYTAKDIRYTAKDAATYAICLGWPGKELTLKSLWSLYPGEIASVRMLGVDQELGWTLSEHGLTVGLPDQRPCDDAYVIQIVRKPPF
jgi:alpha-L-fucosidase